jgi:hypothetical protein
MPRLKVKGWSNGQPRSSGAGLGMRLRSEDRDRYLGPYHDEVQVRHGDTGEVVTLTLSDSFWRACSEFRSAAIGRWLLANNLAPWPKGAPPILDLEILEDGSFRLEVPRRAAQPAPEGRDS